MSRSGSPGAKRPSVEPTPGVSTPVIEEASSAGCLLRLFWMGAGNLVLLYFAGSIARAPSWTFTWRDIAFWLLVATLIGARYLDVARFEGLTVQAEPATPQHVVRYAVLLVIVGLILWLAAQWVET